MNILDAEITEITLIESRDNYWYVYYKYNVWGSIRDGVDRFKYREDAEKLKVGTTIRV